MRFLKQFFVILFSLWVWISSTIMIILSLSCLTLFRLTGINRFRQISFKLFSLVPYLSFSKITLTYHPDYDSKRMSVYCQNHVSILDGFTAAIAIQDKFCGMMHKWQFNIPLYGWLMKLGQGIAIERDKANRLEQLIISMQDRAKANIPILTFPEGTRTRNGNLSDFKTGVFIAAGAAGLPIVPIAVKGMFQVNQAKSFVIKPGTINIFVGPQFETVGLSKNKLIELSQQCHALISAQIQ